MFEISYCIWCVHLDLWGYIEGEPMQILTEDVRKFSIVMDKENKFEYVFMRDGVYIGDGPSAVSVPCIRVMRWVSAAIIYEDVPNQMMYVLLFFWGSNWVLLIIVLLIKLLLLWVSQNVMEWSHNNVWWNLWNSLGSAASQRKQW